MQFFYDDLWKVVDEDHGSAKAGKITMNTSLRDSFKIYSRYKGILSQMYTAIEHIRDPKERFHAGQKYITGVAREVLGEDEKDMFPSIWTGDVPQAIEKIRDKEIGTLIRNATQPALKPGDRKAGEGTLDEWKEKVEDRKSQIRTAIQVLRKTGLSQLEIKKYMREMKRDGSVYRRRFQNNWLLYGGEHEPYDID